MRVRVRVRPHINTHTYLLAVAIVVACTLALIPRHTGSIGHVSCIDGCADCFGRVIEDGRADVEVERVGLETNVSNRGVARLIGR